MPSLCLKSEELNYLSLKAKSNYINYLKFFLRDMSVLSHLFTYSIIYLYRYGFVIIYFILWVISKDFVAQIEKCFLIINLYLKENVI